MEMHECNLLVNGYKICAFLKVGLHFGCFIHLGCGKQSYGGQAKLLFQGKKKTQNLKIFNVQDCCMRVCVFIVICLRGLRWFCVGSGSDQGVAV